MRSLLPREQKSPGCSIQQNNNFTEARFHTKLQKRYDAKPPILKGCAHRKPQQRASQMSAITTTIQKEQNEVIHHKDVPALLVNGIAGSGKTSVLLQRIAYLFYQNRETLNPEQVYLSFEAVTK